VKGLRENARRARRLNRAWLVAAPAILFLLYVWRVPAEKKPAAPAASGLAVSASGLFAPDPAALAEARVVKTVDGDTLRIAWEGRVEFLRYFGVAAPERDMPCYDEASARNRELAGGRVRLAFDARTRDDGGRLLAYVFTEDGLSIDAALVREGLARAWRRDGRFRAELIALDDRARASRTGCLWEAR
jgi:endonuclease YncB( thermonuclease family)